MPEERKKKEEEEKEEAKEIFFFSHIFSHIYPWPHIPRESQKLIRIPLSFSSPFYSPLHLNQHVLTPLSIFRQLLNWSLKFPRRHLDTQVSQKPLIHSLWKLTSFVILSLCQQLPSVCLLFHAMFKPHWTRKTWHLGIWYLKINSSETQFLVCFLNPALFKTFLSRVSSNSIFNICSSQVPLHNLNEFFFLLYPIHSPLKCSVSFRMYVLTHIPYVKSDHFSSPLMLLF